MDIYHTGKEEESDDHKFVSERLLEVAVPEDVGEAGVVTLEACLETYFNNRIEVKRYLERRNTIQSVRSRHSVDSTKAMSSHVEVTEYEDSAPSTPTRLQSIASTTSPTRPTPTRPRAKSIIQDYYYSEKEALLERMSTSDDGKSKTGRPRAGSHKKEVMMPAWQFFSLIRKFALIILIIDLKICITCISIKSFFMPSGAVIVPFYGRVYGAVLTRQGLRRQNSKVLECAKLGFKPNDPRFRRAPGGFQVVSGGF